ncbi:MAG TPA: hypothetical protein ENI07_15340 [Desulfobacterales bacterium]|nr:hypothetical protein [Desulfobacterales bacterium]
MDVQRFIIRAFPSEKHARYNPWQAATVVMLIGENDKEKSQRIALFELSKRNWVPEKFIRRDTMIEDLVREEGGDLWEAYQKAQKGKIFWLEDSEEIPFSTKDKPIFISAPRLTEEFIDRVVEGAGGHRLTKAEAAEYKKKNADYILDDFVIELKDLQQEGLAVSTRQKKIAELFSKYPSEGPVQQLDPFILSDFDFKKYMDIVGTPVKKRILTANKQIKTTIKQMGLNEHKGIVILLNTGYSSIPHKFLKYLGKRYASKDTSSVTDVVLISSWTITNGFDSVVNFAFSPHKPDDGSLGKLYESFWQNINELMNEWAKTGFMPQKNQQDPMKPVSFEHENQVYTFSVPKIESSIPKPK